MRSRNFSAGEKPTPQPAKTERRAKVRYARSQEAFCQPITEEDLWWQATICNISCGGVGLVSARRLEPGTRLVLELEGIPRPRQARVIHATRQAEGGWKVGCEFINCLSDDELQTLL